MYRSMVKKQNSQLILDCNDNLKHAFKVACVKQNASMSEVLRDYMESYVRKSGTPLAKPAPNIN